MLYAVPRWRPAARATSLAFNGRSEACNVRSTLAAATTAPTGLPGLPRLGSPAPARRGVALVRSVSRPFAWRARAVEPASGGPSILSPYQTRCPVQDDMISPRRSHRNTNHMSSIQDTVLDALVNGLGSVHASRRTP